MVRTFRRQFAMVAFVGVIITGALGGCSSNTPPPAIPTSVEQLEDEAKELGQGIADLAKDTAQKLKDVVDKQVPDVNLHFDNLRAEAQSLYCTAKAKSAEAAAAVKAEVEKIWNEQLAANPTYTGPKLDLDGTACQ